MGSQQGFRHRSVVVFVVVLLVVGGLWRCSVDFSRRSVPPVTWDDVEKPMLAHLEEKYGEPFAYARTRMGAFQGVYALSSVPEDYVYARAMILKGEWHFSDGYVGNLMRPVYEKKAANVVWPYLPGCLIEVKSPGQHHDFATWMDASTTFEEFKQHIETPGYEKRIHFTVHLPVSEVVTQASVEELMPTLTEELSEIASDGHIFIVGYTPEMFEERVVPVYGDPSLRYGRGFPLSSVAEFLVSDQWWKE